MSNLPVCMVHALNSAVTKTRNGMEQNGMERSVIFRLLAKSLDLGLGIPKSKFLGFRERYCMASGRRIRKRTGWNSPFRSVPFHSIPGFSNHPKQTAENSCKLLFKDCHASPNDKYTWLIYSCDDRHSVQYTCHTPTQEVCSARLYISHPECPLRVPEAYNCVS